MEKLSMCRICLIEDFQMHTIRNKQLQETYECLTTSPFVTEDSRPVRVCYICSARLWNCYQLKKSCLRSEEVFQQILNSNMVKPVLPQYSPSRPRFRIEHPVVQMSIGDALLAETSSDARRNEVFFHVEVKEEGIEDRITKGELRDNDTSSYDSDDQPLHMMKKEVKTTITNNRSQEYDGTREDYTRSLDSKDNVPFLNVKEELWDAMKSAPVPLATQKKQKKKLQADTDQNISKQCKMGSETNDAPKKKRCRNSITVQPLCCQYCQKSFTSNSHLQIHVRTHTGERPYPCDVCKKSFVEKKSLRNHMRIHTGEKPFKCPVCGKCFTINKYLKVHVRIHKEEKPYQCNVCEKTFAIQTHLDKHTRLHYGEKPYQCDVCKKRFTEKASLKNHARLHTGEKPYQCDTCKKYFSAKKDLKAHIKVHTGEKSHKCHVCNRCFLEKCNLTAHIRSHTGEKPYECQVCKKCFSVKSNLNAHIRVHSGEKPYQCNICKKCFSLKNNLNVHVRLHTVEKSYQCKVCEESFPDEKLLEAHIHSSNYYPWVCGALSIPAGPSQPYLEASTPAE